MKLKQLADIVNYSLKASPESADRDVVIKSSEPSIGFMSCVIVDSAGLGFDWDSSRFILWPEEAMMRVKK